MKILLCVLCIFFCTCAREPEPSFDSLLRGVAEQPYTQTIDEYPFRVSLTYRPNWYVTAQDLKDLGKQEDIDPNAVASLLDTYKGVVTFVLKVGPHPDLPKAQHKGADIVNSQPDLPTFSANLHHLMYGLQDRIYVLTDSGRLNLGQYVLDRNWGIGVTNRFLLTFPESDGEIDLKQEPQFEVVVQPFTRRCRNCDSTLPRVRYEREL